MASITNLPTLNALFKTIYADKVSDLVPLKF